MANILVIEDQEVLCQLYRSVLTQFGHKVVVAHTGEAGIEAASRDTPDLIILDLRLPGMRGIEVVRKLQASGVLPGIPLVITTALEELEATTIAQSVNATALLIKPFDMDSLVATVGRALESARQKARYP